MDGQKYIDIIEKRYNTIKDNLLKVHPGDFKHWYYPPLAGLQLNYQNTMADDGFAGKVLVTSEHDGSFPADRINDPGENYFNGHLAEEDMGGQPGKQ